MTTSSIQFQTHVLLFLSVEIRRDNVYHIVRGYHTSFSSFSSVKNGSYSRISIKFRRVETNRNHVLSLAELTKAKKLKLLYSKICNNFCRIETNRKSVLDLVELSEA